MDDDKTLIDKTIETIKHVAQVATNAAMHALEPEPVKPGDDVVDLPATGTGILMDDPVIEPFVIIPRRKKSAPRKTTPDTSGRITPTYDFPLPTSKMPVRKKAAKKTAKKTKTKTVAKKRPAKKSAKKNAAKKWKSPAKVTAKKRKKTGKKAVKKAKR
jgi:hypothetical protein